MAIVGHGGLFFLNKKKRLVSEAPLWTKELFLPFALLAFLGLLRFFDFLFGFLFHIVPFRSEKR